MKFKKNAISALLSSSIVINAMIKINDVIERVFQVCTFKNEINVVHK